MDGDRPNFLISIVDHRYVIDSDSAADGIEVDGLGDRYVRLAVSWEDLYGCIPLDSVSACVFLDACEILCRYRKLAFA
jgi:hypothetical protein